MTSWNPEELRRIGAADELDIAPARADGTLRRSTMIWVVRVDDDLYVRSYRGPGGAWYRTAQASHEGRIRAGGVERDVFFDEPDYTVRGAVDVAYRTKYARYGDTYVVPMVDDDAAAATFRLTPPGDPGRPAQRKESTGHGRGQGALGRREDVRRLRPRTGALHRRRALR
jgi:hypothetical protein